MEIQIDKEFQDLIPPLSSDEYAQLEQNCIKDGIRDSLVLWKRQDADPILIDGHNRYRIAREHDLPFRTEEREFPDRDAVKIWIGQNQLGRRNLNAYVKGTIVLWMKPLIAKRSRQGERNDLKDNLSENSPKSLDTREELAKIAGVSSNTISRVETLERYATPEVKEELKSGKKSINRAYTELQKVKAIEESGNDGLKERVREGQLTISQAFNSLHPKQDKKATIRQAKEEHKRFEEAKKESTLLNLHDAQIDESNQKIITYAAIDDIEKILSASEAFGLKHKRSELHGIKKVLSKAEAQNLMMRISDCISALGVLNNIIRQEVNN